MKSKRVVALGSALAIGAATVLGGAPISVLAQEAQLVSETAPSLFGVRAVEVPAQENNVALRKTATASSQENNDLGPANLLDGLGSNASRWSSARGTGPQHVVIDLGQVYDLTGINLFWESGKANGYSVQVSNDKNEWTSAYENPTHPETIRDFITFAQPKSGRYVKLQINAVTNVDPLGVVANWDTISLYEIQVLGTQQTVEVNKTALQEMYNAKKGLTPEYITNSSGIVKNYNNAVGKAEELLAEGAATTQEVVDAATAELERCWYCFKLEECNYYYSPTKTNYDYNQCVTESILPLIAVYEEAGGYRPNRTTEEARKLYNAYLEAAKKVESAPENPRGMSVGINSDVCSQSGSNRFYAQVGKFAFSEHMKTNEDGTKTPMLRVEYVYDGKSPLTDEEVIKNYRWTESEIKNSEVRFSYIPYHPTPNDQGGTIYMTDYLTEKTEKGFVAEVPITLKGAGKYTINMYKKNSSSKRMDSLGYYYTKEYMTTMNAAPVIHAEDVTLLVGDEFDPLENVTATDAEDGTIELTTAHIRENDVNVEKAGTYHVTYEVTDSQGIITTKTITVWVCEEGMEINKAPIISLVSGKDEITLQVGDEFDPLSVVTVTDEEDKTIMLTEENVIENTVDTQKAGTYYVVYKVADSQGASVKKTITVTVKAKEDGKPENPDKPETPDKPENPSKPDKPNKTEKPNGQSTTPKTGDLSGVGTAVSMFVISTGALAALVGKRRKK